jgi:integrase
MASLKKRGDTFYLQYYLPGKIQRRVNLNTDSFQIAREKLRRFESSQAMGGELSFPTRTPLDEIVNAYVQHIRAFKKAKSAQTDVYYLRDLFGPICDALQITSRKVSAKTKKRPPKPGQDRRCKATVLDAPCLEQITTAQISSFISGRTQSRGLAPKTANRYHEILVRLFHWAADQRGLILPGGVNPALKVERYKEPAPEIRFLTLAQVDAQLELLKDTPKLQAMVATYIYAGLRREELLWLTHDDIDWNAKPFGLIRVCAKTIAGESWEPKTKINRAVPVSSRLLPYLEKQRLRSAKSTWLFPAPEGGRWDGDNFSADVRVLNQAASLSWGCLDFRHTFGSQLAMANVSLHKISKLMGNSPEICRRHYAAIIPEELADCVEFPTTKKQTSIGQAATA